jgi:CheY-like chemotaxis protein
MCRLPSASALWLDDLAAPQPPPNPPSRGLVVPIPPAALSPLEGAAAARAEKKNARRAEVRRLRLQERAPSGGCALEAPTILVLDAEAVSREQLGGLLDELGFASVLACSLSQAREAATAKPFAAVFVDIALQTDEGGDGIDVCARVGDAGWLDPASASALVLVAAHLRPRDRVRAELAGCADAILKPVSRSAVARLLDGRGIALPSDRRRA